MKRRIKVNRHVRKGHLVKGYTKKIKKRGLFLSKPSREKFNRELELETIEYQNQLLAQERANKASRRKPEPVFSFKSEDKPIKTVDYDELSELYNKRRVDSKAAKGKIKNYFTLNLEKPGKLNFLEAAGHKVKEIEPMAKSADLDIRDIVLDSAQKERRQEVKDFASRLGVKPAKEIINQPSSNIGIVEDESRLGLLPDPSKALKKKYGHMKRRR